MLRNTSGSYGWIAIILHWLVAVAVIGLFALGLYMTGLSYYDPFYRQGPFIHKSIGILLFMLVAFRLVWRLINPRPAPVPTIKRWEHIGAELAHWGLYLLMFAVMVSGYLISTADGRAIDVFGWFSVPAWITGLPRQEDIAGAVHYWLAMVLIGLAVLHGLAALKHHFWDRDDTLRRMLRVSRNRS